MASTQTAGDFHHTGNKVVLSLNRERNSAVRVFSVYDITSLADSAWLMDAAQAQSSGLPALGDVHPYNSTLICKDIEASVDAAHDNQALVSCVYGPPDIVESNTAEPEWDIEAYLAEFATNYDRNGNLIDVTYLPTGGTSPGVTQTARVTTTIPTIRIRGSRVETANPYSKILTHAGKTNSAAWGPFGTTEVKRSWLMNIRASTKDGGSTYTVEYEVLRLMERLDPEVRWLADDGKTPDDVSDGNGIEFPEVIEEANFATLALT